MHTLYKFGRNIKKDHYNYNRNCMCLISFSWGRGGLVPIKSRTGSGCFSDGQVAGGQWGSGCLGAGVGNVVK